jgi:hypothetical protein
MVLLGSAFGQHIQTDFDHRASFSQYQTYSWQEIKPADLLSDSRMKNAVDAQYRRRVGHKATTVAMLPSWRSS